MTKPTVNQAIRRSLLQEAKEEEWGVEDGFKWPENITYDNVEDVWDDLCELDDKFEDWMNEWVNEFRNDYDEETDIECDWSRNYESKSVAKKLHDGTWIGWTYWYGGGKHGDPDSIDWLRDAYFLDVVEEEKLVMVKTFKIKNE